MNLGARCQPVTSQPSSSLPCHIVGPCTLPGQNLPWAPNDGTWEGVWRWHQGTAVSVSNQKPPSTQPGSRLPLCWVPQNSSLLGCCESHTVTCRSKGKNRCPNKFLSKRNYLGIRKPHGGGEDRNRCMTFKYAIIILQKFKYSRGLNDGSWERPPPLYFGPLLSLQPWTLWWPLLYTDGALSKRTACRTKVSSWVLFPK